MVIINAMNACTIILYTVQQVAAINTEPIIYIYIYIYIKALLFRLGLLLVHWQPGDLFALYTAICIPLVTKLSTTMFLWSFIQCIIPCMYALEIKIKLAKSSL